MGSVFSSVFSDARSAVLFVLCGILLVLAVVSLIIGSIVNLFNFIVNCVVIVGTIAGMLGAWRKNHLFLFICMIIFAVFAVIHAVLFFVNLAGGHWGYLGITIVQFVIEVVIVVLCWLLRDRSFRPSSSSSSHPPS